MTMLVIQEYHSSGTAGSPIPESLPPSVLIHCVVDGPGMVISHAQALSHLALLEAHFRSAGLPVIDLLPGEVLEKPF